MKNKLGLFLVLFTILVSVFASNVSNVAANGWYEDDPDIIEMNVYVQGELVWYGECYNGANSPYDPWKCEVNQINTPSIERGETLPVKVVFESQEDHSEVVVKSWINGYREDIEDETEEFDVFEDHQYVKYLYLDIPEDIGATEDYTLYVEIQNSVVFDGVAEAEIELQVQEISNVLEIKSIELYAGMDVCGCYLEQIHFGVCGGCSISFEAGSTLYADIVVKNMGSQTQEDVYVKMSIPSECIERTIYLGDLDSGETEKVTLYIILPEQDGSYEIEVEAFNEDVSSKVEQEITIAESESETDVSIMIPQTRINVVQGGSAVYSIYVANTGSAETFVVSVEGTQGWAIVQVNPMTFTLTEGQSKLVNISLTVDQEALVAEHQFTVKVAYGNEVKSYNFSANVTENSGLELRYLLLIIGIVLAVAIVILLILLLTKNGKSKVEKSEEEYSYY
jgi:uncharacterized membrane protein